MAINLQDATESAKHAARKAGHLLRSMQADVEPHEKGPKDLVTAADLASQQLIFTHLTRDFPSIDWIGEEDEDRSHRPAGPLAPHECCWIVDPLDGTTNYVHGMDNYSVSIALRRGDNVVVGVIYDPMRDVMFSAIRGGGAFRDAQRLHVSRVRKLDEALVAASFPANVAPDSPEVARFLAVLCECQALRRLGSAALNLCYVAAGQLDAYWATSVKIWDVAAGLLLVAEAGGTITTLEGRELAIDDPKFAASATSELHDGLLRQLARKSR